MLVKRACCILNVTGSFFIRDCILLKKLNFEIKRLFRYAQNTMFVVKKVLQTRINKGLTDFYGEVK